MGNKSKRRQVIKRRYIINVANESLEKKHRPRGCDTWAAAKALERLINADFTVCDFNLNFQINYQEPSALEENDWSFERMTENISEALKFLDTVFPVPAYDQKGILIHSKLKLQSHAVRWP